MSSKRSNIPVAVPNDDGSSAIVGSEELRAEQAAHEAREAKISADADAERLITNYLNGKRPTALQLLFHLALAEHHGRSIPAGLIRPIALASRASWVRGSLTGSVNRSSSKIDRVPPPTSASNTS